jgi:hypothetical protein
VSSRKGERRKEEGGRRKEEGGRETGSLADRIARSTEL